MGLNEYLAANGNWIRAGSTAAICTCAPAEWAALCVAAAQLGGADPGIDCQVEVEELGLAEILANVAGWIRPGSPARIDCGGFEAVLFRGTKRLRSRERERDWVVLDLLDRRLVIA